jgi:hypothetical protein
VFARAKLAAFLALDGAQRRMLFLALVLLPLHAVALRCFALRRVQRLLPPLFRAAARSTLSAAQTTRLVEVAARRGPYRAACLPASLTLQLLLRANGIDSDLRLGVRKTTHGLEAHAWLEGDGAVLLDLRDAGEHFAALERVVDPAPGTSG